MGRHGYIVSASYKDVQEEEGRDAVVDLLERVVVHLEPHTEGRRQHLRPQRGGRRGHGGCRPNEAVAAQ